jgi:hypothetical protein
MEAVRQVLVRLKGRVVPDPGERFWSDFPGRVHVKFRAASDQPLAVRPFPEHLSQRLTELVFKRSAERVSWKGNRSWALALAASVMLLLGSWVLVARQHSPAPGQAPAGLASKAPLKATLADLPDLSEIDWEDTLEDDDPDTMLVELAARLDPPTLDRLFNDI